MHYVDGMTTSIFPHTFRLHWLVSYLMVSVPTQTVLIGLFAAGACYQFIQNGGVTQLDDYLVTGARMSAVTGVILLPIAMRFNHRGRARIGPFGIEAIDDSGTRWMIDWTKMESVAILRYWGWRTIRVRSAEGRTFWLPLYVSHPDEYREVVERCAGPDHPLSRALSFARPES